MNTFNRIKETQEIIQKCKDIHKALNLPDFIRDLEISSLEQRLVDLEKQRESEQLEEIELKLYPPELPSGQVPVRSFTAILGGLQSLTDSIANSIFNQPSNRGPIPQDILEKNSLILKATKAGSFVAHLNLQHEQQLTFDESPQQQVLQELFGLFNASDEEESLLDIISSMGTRTIKYYTDWTKSIKDLNTKVELNWRSVEQSESASFDSEKAGRIFTVLNEKLRYTEEEVTLEGKLTGVNVRLGVFELCMETGEKISGKILKESIANAVSHLDKNCNAGLLKIRTVSSAGKEKVSWVLNEVNTVE